MPSSASVAGRRGLGQSALVPCTAPGLLLGLGGSCKALLAVRPSPPCQRGWQVLPSATCLVQSPSQAAGRAQRKKGWPGGSQGLVSPPVTGTGGRGAQGALPGRSLYPQTVGEHRSRCSSLTTFAIALPFPCLKYISCLSQSFPLDIHTISFRHLL